MSTDFDEIRGQAMEMDVLDSAPTGEDVYEGRKYLDSTTGIYYVYVGGAWRHFQMTTTSISTTSSSSSSSSTSSTSTSTTSISTSSTSISTTSSSTSTTLL